MRQDYVTLSEKLTFNRQSIKRLPVLKRLFKEMTYIEPDKALDISRDTSLLKIVYQNRHYINVPFNSIKLITYDHYKNLIIIKCNGFLDEIFTVDNVSHSLKHILTLWDDYKNDVARFAGR